MKSSQITKRVIDGKQPTIRTINDNDTEVTTSCAKCSGMK